MLKRLIVAQLGTMQHLSTIGALDHLMEHWKDNASLGKLFGVFTLIHWSKIWMFFMYYTFKMSFHFIGMIIQLYEHLKSCPFIN